MMENKNNVKYEKLYQILSLYDFAVDENELSNIKCDICNKILINACQSRCGCRFCQKCLNENLLKGQRFCQGDQEECKEEDLSIESNIHTDFRANRKIAKLMVKCPEENCYYKCELINMEEHFRLCTVKSIRCPYFELGCDREKIAQIDLNDHLQNDNLNHSKIIIDIIRNLKNEVSRLLQNEFLNRKEITLLKEQSKIIETKIETINDEIKIIRIERQELYQQFENLKEFFQNNNEVINENIKEENVQTKNLKNWLKKLQIEIDKINETIDQFKTNIQLKIDEFELCLQRKLDATAGIFSWTIHNISMKRELNESIFSECFYTKINKFKISLQLISNGSNEMIGSGFSLYLFVYEGINVNSITWPFRATITFKLANKSKPDANKISSKFCQISKPPNNYNWSDPFHFVYDELFALGLFIGDCFVIECFVDEN